MQAAATCGKRKSSPSPLSSHLHWHLPKQTVTTFLKERAKTQGGEGPDNEWTESISSSFALSGTNWLRTNTQTVETVAESN